MGGAPGGGGGAPRPRARRPPGLLVADAFGAAPYALIDIDELNADVVALSAPAWGGPQIGALVFRDPAFLDRIPSMSLNPYAKGAERLEVGGHQYALLAGLTSSIDFLAGLDDRARGTRRERLEISITSLQDYHDQLFEHLMDTLDKIPNLTVIGRASTRIPTVSFTIAGMQAEKVAATLADARISTLSGVHGGSRLLDALGVNDEGGAVTVGLAPYTTRFEIDQLGRALAALD